MHPVLHRWCKELGESEEREMLGRHAGRLVAEVVPSGSESAYWQVGRRLLPHASRVYEWIDREFQVGADGVGGDVERDATFELGYLFSRHGRMKAAEKMYVRALEGKEKAWGPDHTSTLDTVYNLGNLYWKQGKMEEAEKTYLRALGGYEKAVGPESVN